MNASSRPSDPHRRLTPDEVREQAGHGFAQLGGKLAARYRTGDFATGLDLANRIAALAEKWDHHPDLNLTYSNLVVTLVSHDDDAITPRDIRMSHLVAEAAAELGIAADVGGLTVVDWGLDTLDGGRLAPFYAALLGGEIRGGEPVDASGQAPTIWWQHTDGATRSVDDQRWHADVWVAQEAASERLAAVLAAGGVLVSDENAPSFWVVADAEGNRHCICTPAGR